jgi:predicted phosphodiesterase
MILGLISDIHGNFEALKAVLAELDRLGVDKVFCLGDVVGYYPQINECCEELRSREISSLMEITIGIFVVVAFVLVPRA